MDDRRLHELARLIASSPHNLVSRPERPYVLERHVLEAVAVSEELDLTPGSRWLDLGTGGGLPGLVLAMRSPRVHWVLLDATRKKIDEVRRFAAALELGNVAAVHGRAEELHRERAWRGSFDGVVARAVAPLAGLSRLAQPFLRRDGLLVAIKGPRWTQELEEARRAGALRSFREPSTAAVAGAVRPTWVVTMRLERASPASTTRSGARGGRRGGAG